MPSRSKVPATAPKMRWRTGLVAVLAIVPLRQVRAQIYTLKPTATLAIGHDSNVFRLEDPSTVQAQGGISAADTIERARIGASGVAKWNLQTLTLSGALGHDRYQQNTYLDNNNWQLGLLANLKYARLVTLDVDARAERRLESFTYRQNTQASFSTITRSRADLRYNLGADYSVGAALTDYTLRSTLLSSQDYNVDELGYEVSAGYQRLTPWDLRLAYLHLDGNFPDRIVVPGDTREQHYTQDTLGIKTRYENSGVSQFAGEAGYTKRSSPFQGAPEFSGLTGRLSYQRTLSPKTQFRVETLSQVYSVADTSASSVLQTGGTTGLTWRYSPLLAFTGGVDAYRYRYRGATEDVIVEQGGVERTDTVVSLRAGAEYQAWRNLFIVPQWQYERRKSDLLGRSYDYQYAELAVRYDYLDIPAVLGGADIP